MVGCDWRRDNKGGGRDKTSDCGSSWEGRAAPFMARGDINGGEARPGVSLLSSAYLGYKPFDFIIQLSPALCMSGEAILDVFSRELYVWRGFVSRYTKMGNVRRTLHGTAVKIP